MSTPPLAYFVGALIVFHCVRYIYEIYIPFLYIYALCTYIQYTVCIQMYYTLTLVFSGYTIKAPPTPPLSTCKNFAQTELLVVHKLSSNMIFSDSLWLHFLSYTIFFTTSSFAIIISLLLLLYTLNLPFFYTYIMYIHKYTHCIFIVK